MEQGGGGTRRWNEEEMRGKEGKDGFPAFWMKLGAAPSQA